MNEDPVEKAIRLSKEAKMHKKVPFLSLNTRKKLEELKMKEFKRETAEKELEQQAIELNRILDIDNIDYAKSLIKKHGSLSNAILAYRSNPVDLVDKLGNYVRTSPVPRMDKPTLFLNDVIRDAYPIYSETYNSSERVADALREYVRLSKEYKEDLEELISKLDRLTLMLSTSMNIPRHELRPLISTILPLAYQEPNFF